MPENNNNCCSDYSKYDSMTIEELEEILRQDAEDLDSEPDVDMLMYIVEVIRSRKGPDPNRKTAEEAFEIFKKHYLPEVIGEGVDDMEGMDVADSEHQEDNKCKVIHMSRWMRRMAAAAAVVVVLLAGSVTANALGYNLWQIVVQWTQETFHFGGASQQETTGPAVDNHLEYSSLQEVLDKQKITVPLAPKWIPDGYVLSDIKVNISPIQESFWAIYLKDDQMLKVQIKRYLQMDPEQIEQSDTLVEEYESGGITYFIFEDNKQFRTAWTVAQFECYISGELTIDEMKQIVDSIKE